MDKRAASKRAWHQAHPRTLTTEQKRDARQRQRQRYPDLKRDEVRRRRSRLGGYVAPPRERDCPPRPADGRCDCCLQLVPGDRPGRFHLDHDHVTGAFRGWTCHACNNGSGLVDQPERLRRRADFLDAVLPWQ
jgi:hypothetical protein